MSKPVKEGAPGSFPWEVALSRCNVAWDSPSADARGSMPLGNGDIGVNVWVEPTGDLVFYVSKTDAWDENGRLCKIGRVRVTLDPPLPVAKGFRQELKLLDGVIEIQSAIGHRSSSIFVWVDTNQPVARVEVRSTTPVTCRARVELWRLRERPFGKEDDSFSGRGLSECDSRPVVLPDVVVPDAGPRVIWYHRNTRSIYPLCLKVQHLESLKDSFADPLLNHTFGAVLSGKAMVGDGPHALKSLAPAKDHSLAVTVLAERAESPDTWLGDLERQERNALQTSPEDSRRATAAWWREFWSRSWIVVEGQDSLTRGYALQRFMSACSGRGAVPIKYNGAIFTVEAKPGASPETPDGDPDWRRWGGCLWFQNTRLLYWPMLASGDFEMMEPLFRMFREALPLSRARIAEYYRFTDAAQFPETMYFWGLPNNGDFGWNNAVCEPENAFIRRYWNNGLELTALMLECYAFTQDRQFARETLVPLADPLIAFLEQYWPKRDAERKILFDPAQSLETWHTAVNPLPEIAALRFLLPRLLALPAELTTEDQRARWTRLLGALPPVPVAEVNGRRMLRPAVSFSDKKNLENPELYGIFPYRLYGVGRPDLDVARDTYEARAFRLNLGWCQDSIQAACLGLGEEAGRLVAQRAAHRNEHFDALLAAKKCYDGLMAGKEKSLDAGRPASSHCEYRFPAMWGPHFDWVPDMNHGGNLLTTLQFMLLQWDGDKIYLLPAWPKEWNVSFKLHAPEQTTVEGVYRAGKLEHLKVTPESRRRDLVACQENS